MYERQKPDTCYTDVGQSTTHGRGGWKGTLNSMPYFKNTSTHIYIDALPDKRG
jgi:hypothetical protein